MAEEGRTMEDTLPAKRARLDFYHHIDECSKSSDNKYTSESETLAGGGGESTLTSDSGFNEFTPPQSIDDDIPNGPSCSQSLSFENNEFEVRIPRDGDFDHSSRPPEDEDDACSVGSTASNLSGLSNFSNISGKDWKPCAGPMSWVQQQMEKGVNPRSVLTQILGGSWQIPNGVSDFMLWHIIINMLSEPPKRERLRHINTLEDVIRLIKVCKKIIILTGAGVSVSCGIPDFRSKDGIYARLSVDFPDLPDPQAMFDISYFRRDPRPFFKFAKEIYPGQFTPSLCHRFIRLIELNNKLLRNYTQNIDTLEQEAGINRVIQCHGSFATATCQKCSYKVEAEVIKEDVFAQRIPMCTICMKEFLSQSEETNSLNVNCHSLPDSSMNPCEDRLSCNGTFNNKVSKHITLDPSCSGGHRPQQTNGSMKFSASLSSPVMKPDIVFFGEGLPDEFHDRMAEDKDECDLLIVIGSSLKVRPVALIPSSIPSHVPQILINREPLNHLTFDVELLGDCDVIVSELCRRLGDGWKDLASGRPLTEIQELPPRSSEAVENEGGGTKAPPLPSPDEAPHPKDESDIEALRACWAPKVKESMAARLPEASYLFCGGHRYVFPGAEVFYDPDDEDEEEDDDDDDDEEEEEEEEEDQSRSSEIDPTHTTHAIHTGTTSVSVAVAAEEDAEDERSSLRNSTEDARTMMTIGSRRSSQALSEDVDSLLSTASCGDPINNTPDYPSESQWGGVDNLGGGELSSHSQGQGGGTGGGRGNSIMIEDWTGLSASLGASSSSSSSSSTGDRMEDAERDLDLKEEGKVKVESLDGTGSRYRCSV